MALQKLTGTDAFIVVDLDGAEAADGVVRWAKKVLLDGARALARSRTYAWALLEQPVSGASAGISAAPEDRAAAVAAFVDEARPRVASGELGLDPAKGVDAEDLAGLLAEDTRPWPVGTGPADVVGSLLAAGAVGAVDAALGGLEGRSVVIEGAGPAGPALARAVAAAGGSVAAVGTPSGTVRAGDAALSDPDVLSTWERVGEALPGELGSQEPAHAVLGVEADALLCGSKVGLVDHDVAAALPQRVVVPVGPLPVTARGLAVARRRDIVVLADFLTTAGPLVASRSPEGAATPPERVAERTASLTKELLDHPDGPLLAACYRAEAFLGTWRDELPFGRPLA